MGRKKKDVTLAEHARRIAPAGGRAAMENRSPEERKQFASSGGQSGGPARAAKLTAKERSEIARKAAKARWAKEKP